MEFNDLFENFDVESVRRKIVLRQLERCHFTTVLWRVFLNCLPDDSREWSDASQTSRNHYSDLVNRYVIDPDKRREFDDEGKRVNHPLSQDDDVIE